MAARAFGLVLVAFFAASAAASSGASDPPRIVPWHLIGNIGLGMSHARVERMYGRAINGDPPRNTIVWRYRGRGAIDVVYDHGVVTGLETSSRAYGTPSGIRVGMTIPRGPCHSIGGKCQYRWHGFRLRELDSPREWDRVAVGPGPVRVAVQLFLGRDGAVDRISLSRYLHCSWGDVVAATCKRPPAPPEPPPPPGLRYCTRPGGPGNYLAASPGVSCGTARTVEVKVFSAACVERTRCSTYGFTCRAFWDGRYDRPFSYTHHAVCRAGRLRIEIDEG